MINEFDNLTWMQKWFYANCNGDWEHNTNIKIVNLDNPGWSVFINLNGTSLENREFLKVKNYRTDDDWIYCVIEDNIFKGACGPFNLNEVLHTFRVWAEISKEV